MRVRTGLRPEDWSENEPAVGRFHGPAPWGTRNATVGAAMLPMVRLPNALSNAEARHARKTQATRDAIRAANRGPVCGVVLPRANGPCARTLGHADSHRSRGALDSAAEARRSGVGRWP